MTSPSSAAVQAEQHPAQIAVNTSSGLGRRLFLVLGSVALIYAFLAGLRTISDPDLGWQMATGRWVAQHHQIPSIDVFSYTANGQPWIYPVGSGLVFYTTYLLGGYALLSWLGAIACVGTVALLLRRGSAFTAALTILAVPLIAERTTPRAEMFTIVLFAAYLSLLWQNYQTGRAPLWLLPVLMLGWVNLHLGFIAGLALIVGFVVVELLELISPMSTRGEALRRLRRALPWYAATAIATLANPWGWGLYQAILRQDRAMAEHSQLILEWASGHWNWSGAIPSFAQSPLQNTLTTLMFVVIVAAVVALLQGRLGAAMLLLGSMYETVLHIRMEALTACIIVVVAGSVLFAAVRQLSLRISNGRVRSLLAIAATVLMAALACVRATGFVNGHIYAAGNRRMSFGTGLAWCLPQHAAEFIERENLPGNIFNSYNFGGYLVWKLGLKYRDYIDGRAIPFGLAALPHEERLLGMSLNSSDWFQEADHYGINTILLPLDDYEIAFEQLPDLCNSTNWAPVYLDELAIVLVRRKPENEQLVQRLQVDCANVSLPSAPLGHDARSYSRWVNLAYVLFALNRNAEALSAANNAFEIFPNSSRLRRVRGDALYALHRREEAEQDWLAALALSQGDAVTDVAVWAQLAELYDQQDRKPEAMHAWQETVRLATDSVTASHAPLKVTRAHALLRLARLYVLAGQPRPALQALDEAVQSAPPVMLEESGGRTFSFDVAQGRAAAWRALGDLQQATQFQEEAVKLDPDAADAWSHLAKLYQRQGRIDDQRKAEQRAAALASP